MPEVILDRVRKFADSRGYFPESYRKGEFAELGIGCELVQDNQASYYAPQSEADLIWNHAAIGIDWLIRAQSVLLSDKDAKLQSLGFVSTPFEMA